MSPDRRKEIFADLAEGWNREKEQIKQMSETEVRQNLECP